MLILTKEVYKCEYCKKLYQVKYACEKHESYCKKRLDYLRPCHNCSVLKKVKATVLGHGDEYKYEYERVFEVLFCSKLDYFIFPPSVAAKGNAFHMDKNNIEMPKECDLYEPY